MLKIGLTGGIGSGKSTVAGYFADLGVPVIDADQLARELVAPGSPTLDEVAAAFGREMLLKDGNLDRSRLRHHIFADPERRRRLEAILHPRIYAEMRRRIEALRAPYCLLVIPLLLETGGTELVERVLVVDIPEPLQRERVRTRDGMSDDEIEAIRRAQVGRSARLSAADDVITNDADLPHLRQRVTELHHRYLTLAGILPSPPEKP